MERSSGLNLIKVWSCEADQGDVIGLDQGEVLGEDLGDDEGCVSSDVVLGGRTLPSLTASD